MGTSLDITVVELIKQNVPYLPINIGESFTNLQIFIVHASRAKFITRKNFANMKKLHHLTLGFNEIETIPFDAFHELTSLEVIGIDHNRLKRLDSRTFASNPKLRSIFAYSNHIEVLEAGLFSNNKVLKQIDFSWNRIKEIHISFDLSHSYNHINFKNNVCIDEAFQGDYNLNEMAKKIRAFCTNAVGRKRSSIRKPTELRFQYGSEDDQQEDEPYIFSP